MHLKISQILMISAVLGACGAAWAVPEPLESTPREIPALERQYAAWVSSLEPGPGPDAGWAFPFAAPGSPDYSEKDLKTILSLRRLVRAADMSALETLADLVARRQGPMPVPMRFWLAFAQHDLNRNQACLENLEALLAVDQGWRDLDPGQCAWVLTTTADLHFLIGSRNLAAVMYRRLVSSPITQLSLWGNYQLAGMDFLAKDFEAASRRYDLVCTGENSGSWRTHACAMSTIAGRMAAINRKGDVHGAVATAGP